MGDTDTDEPFEDSGSEYQPSCISTENGEGEQITRKRQSSDCDSNTTGFSNSKKKCKNQKEKKSMRMNDYYIIEDTDKKKDKVAICILCKNAGKIQKLKMKNYNTSGLKRHLRAKHPIIFDKIFPNQNTTEFSSTATTSKQETGLKQATLLNLFSTTENKGKGIGQSAFHQQEFENLLVHVVAQKYIPFNFFEDDCCEKLFSYCNKNAVLPNRYMLRQKVLTKFNETQQNLKNILQNTNSKISCTIDGWTSIGNKSYYGVTCHFINNSWELKSLVLDFVPSKGKHDAGTMARLFYDVLKDYNIIHKLQGVTTDNASVNFTFMNRHLAELIGPDFDSENSHFVCFAHVLNLAVQDLLKIININYSDDRSQFAATDEDNSSDSDEEDFSNFTGITKIRGLLKKIKYEQQMNKFKSCCNTVNLESSAPIIDVKTRWNSTFEMLKWAVKYKIPLKILCEANEDLAIYRNDEEIWSLIETILKYLRPFKTLTDNLAGEQYCTLSMVVIGINLLLDKLETWAFELNDKANRSNNDEKFITALNAARDKILKHYRNTNWVYCIALILDPRHKKETFSLTKWGKELENTAFEKFEEVYKDNYFVPTGTGTGTEPNVEPTANSSSIDIDDLDFGQLFSQCQSNREASEEWNKEIEEYLNVKRADQQTNILDWWKKHEYTYPTLSRMAKDIFSITATSVPSERMFSKASLFIRKHRNRLNTESARSLICLNSWIKEQIEHWKYADVELQ